MVHDELALIARQVLDGHIGGIGVLGEDLHGHLARLIAQVVIVDAIRRQPSVLDHGVASYDDGERILIGDHGNGRHARGDSVVGGGVDRVDLSHHGFDHLLNLVGGRHGVPLVRDAGRVQRLFGELDLNLGVGLR